MHTMIHSLLCGMLMFSTLLSGCVHDAVFGRAKPESAPGVKHVELSIDIAIQRSQWGGNVGRCHLQAALRTYEPQDNDMVPFGESTGSQIILPSTPDTCEHSFLEVTGAPIEPGSEEDNWQIAGEDVAADSIQLHSGERTIILDQVGLDGDAVRYEWLDCTQETFPFGQVFDLEMDDDPGLDVPGFLVEDAFAVGPDVAFVDIEGSPYFHDQGSDLELAWTELHEWPTVRGEEVDVERILWARNRAMDELMPFEALACLPSGTTMMVNSSDWEKLEANHDEQDRSHLVGLQVDTVATSPPFDAPWGQTISIRSTVSDGGDVHLLSAY